MTAPAEPSLTYKAYLRAVGRQPVPAYDELRTPRSAGDVELPSATKPWWKEQRSGHAHLAVTPRTDAPSRLGREGVR